MNLLNNNIVKGNKYNLSNPVSSHLVVNLCTKNSDSTIERTCGISNRIILN
jgi:hypothetical protein